MNEKNCFRNNSYKTIISFHKLEAVVVQKISNQFLLGWESPKVLSTINSSSKFKIHTALCVTSWPQMNVSVQVMHTLRQVAEMKHFHAF